MLGQKFSVIMSVYAGDKAEYLQASIDSIYANTLQPNEIVLVVDGPVGDDISRVIKKYENQWPENLKVILLEDNKGHGNARRVAMDNASYEIIAVMDSDDICVPERFAKQIDYIKNHPEVSVVGGNIAEFIDTVSNVVGCRVVPGENSEIYKYLKRRCPFNHVSVMFRKAAVESAGGYIDWHYNEDYYLWIRMAEKGYKFANLPEILVNVRVGKDMYQRRGGWKYFISEYKLQKYMLAKGVISCPIFAWNVILRFLLQVVFPNNLRGFIFQKLARK